MSPEFSGSTHPDNMDDIPSEVNERLLRGAYETISQQAELLIEAGFKLVQRFVEQDRQAFIRYDADESPTKELILQVAPGINEALWEDDEPQPTLTVVLKSKYDTDGMCGGVGDADTYGDRLEISIPTEPDYTYPSTLEDSALPPTMYLRHVPATEKNQDPTRYVITQDENNLGRYRLYEYTSYFDYDQQEVLDDFTEAKVLEVFSRQLPKELQTIFQLYTFFTNFEAKPQTRITPYGKDNLI